MCNKMRAPQGLETKFSYRKRHWRVADMAEGLSFSFPEGEFRPNFTFPEGELRLTFPLWEVQIAGHGLGLSPCLSSTAGGETG